MDIKTVLCVGGTNVRETIADLKRGVHVVVGTPGRVVHMIDEGHLDTREVKVFILDEADVMLSEGFIDVIKDIFSFLPKDVQVGLFSATLPETVMEITARFMSNPIHILVEKEHLTLSGITQYFVNCEQGRYKYETLAELYGDFNIGQAVIFCNTKRSVDRLKEDMTRDSFTVSCIHAGLPPVERDEVMKDFRVGNSRVLIATDILARGIDVQGVSLVINFEMPRDKENYLHRVGRGGRFGRKGLAINLIAGDQEFRMKGEIERFYDTSIDSLPADFATALGALKKFVLITE